MKVLNKFFLFYFDDIDYVTSLLLLPVFFILGNWILTSIFLTLVFWFLCLNIFNKNEISLELRDKTFLVGLFFAGIIGLSKSPELSTGLRYFLGTIIVPIFTFFIFTNIKLKISSIRYFINLLICTGVVLSSFSIYISVFILSSYDVRLSSFWADFNILAAFLMIIFFFNLLFVIYEKKRFLQILYLASMTIILFGIFLTQTRGVWLATGISLLIYVMRKPKALVPSLFIVGIFVILFFPIFLNRFLSVRFFTSDGSALGRIQAWLVSILIIKDHFLFGIGFETFYRFKYNYMSFFIVDVIHPHNTYLRFLVEMGFFGFFFYMYFYLKALFLSFYSKKFYRSSNLYSQVIEGLQLSFIGLSIAFMFEPYFSLYGNSTLIIWMLMGLSYNLYYRRYLYA